MRRKKKIVLVINLLAVGVFLFSSLEFTWAYSISEEVKLKSPKINPYSYDPLKKRMPPSRVDRARREPLVSVAPDQPAVVTDVEGNKLCYFQGKLRFQVDLEGNQTFFSNNMPSLEKDFEGELTRKYQSEGDGLVAAFNEHGDLLGYKQYGRGRKVLEEFDGDRNPTRSYEYGSNLKWIIDEITGIKTECNEYGKALRDVDFEGNTLATYEYSDVGWRLARRIEKTLDDYGNVVDGDVTIYDDLGRRPLYKENHLKERFSIFDYDSVNKYKLLSISETGEDNSRTIIYDRKGRTIEELDFLGNLLKTYSWEGTRLISSFDRQTDEVTWYDVNKNPLATTFNGHVVRIWIREMGKLIGEYDVRSQALIIHYNNQEWGSFWEKFEDLPVLDAYVLEEIEDVKGVEEAVKDWIRTANVDGEGIVDLIQRLEKAFEAENKGEKSTTQEKEEIIRANKEEKREDKDGENSKAKGKGSKKKGGKKR